MSTIVGKTNHNITGSNAFIDLPNCSSNHSTTSSVHDEFNDESIEYKPTTPTAATKKLSTLAKASALSPAHAPPLSLSPTTISTARLNSTILSDLHFRKENFGKTMGGLSIPNHGLSAAFHGYHSHNSVLNHANHHTNNNSNSSNSHLNGTNTSINNNIHHHSNNNNNHNNNNVNSFMNSHHSSNNSSNHVNTKSPFLLPAQLYKSLFANAVLQAPDKMCSHPFPRNLLFSYSSDNKSPNSPDYETEDKSSLVDEVSH